MSFESGSQLTSIGYRAFRESGLIGSITLPASVTNLGTGGGGVFRLCSTLTSVNFESGSQLDIIWSNCFESTGLSSITLPASLTEIRASAFRDCSNLASVSFESGSQLTLIGISAFRESGLTSITIPSTVTTIGNGAFQDCTALTSVTFEPNCQPTAFFSTAFLGSGLTQVYMNSNTLNHLNSIFSPTLFFGLNSSFFGATNVEIINTDPPPAPPPPIPPPISNRPGPIQYCTSRFARCNINKKTSFSSGNVTIQGTTNARRQSLIVNQSTYRHGAKLLFSNQVLNAYGRKAGGPGGFGASPRNQF